jgi:imidazoleglycerol-phosphate dehydratase/histidinol-phosphatase
MSRTPFLFIDRDGTLVEEPPDEQVDAVEKVRLVEGVIPALLQLRDAGYRFVIVSNQDGRGTPSFPESDFAPVQAFISALFASQGLCFDAEFFCPHLPEDGCACRKPRTGLLTRFLVENPPDLERSYVIGDRETDLELAANLGLKGLKVGPDGDAWPAVARQILEGARRGRVRRRTKETDIAVSVDLNAAGPVAIATGIGYYDHMLEQVARHGGIALDIACAGDLEVDAHHTVEDVALALGQALRDALGEKRGIGRYGFLLPMDETLAQVALDLGGRPYAVFEGRIPGERVGELPTEMVPHFFRSLADSLGASIHVKVTGENAHHMVEGCFKALGRTLRDAVRLAGHDIPSTKGVLA